VLRSSGDPQTATTAAGRADQAGYPRWLSQPRCILRDVSCQETGTARAIGVIGQCTVSSCSRQAARHVLIRTRRSVTIAGTVCEHCARATALAAFLLDLLG
jgi:hypothetical protein